MADCRNASGPVDAQANQAGRRLRGLPRVETHADTDRFAAWPRVGAERSLHLDRRRDTGTRRREHREERVTLGVNLLAAVCGKARPDQPMMISQYLRVQIPAARQQRRGTLDIGEQKGERLRGQQPKTSI